MFLSRKEIFIIKLKKVRDAIVGGFFLALPILLVMILWAMEY